MSRNNLQITPAVYRCVQSLLSAICTFGVEPYAPTRTLTELELYFAREALNYVVMREQFGAQAGAAKQDLEKSVNAFKGSYAAAMRNSQVKEAFCHEVEWADGLRFGGSTGWPARAADTEPTVAGALAVAEQTMAEYQSLYETLLFLTSQVPDGLKSGEAAVVQNELNQRFAHAQVQMLQFKILATSPETLAALKKGLKPKFQEPYSVMQHLSFGGTVPNGWPTLLEARFRENLLQS